MDEKEEAKSILQQLAELYLKPGFSQTSKKIIPNNPKVIPIIVETLNSQGYTVRVEEYEGGRRKFLLHISKS